MSIVLHHSTIVYIDSDGYSSPPLNYSIYIYSDEYSSPPLNYSFKMGVGLLPIGAQTAVPNGLRFGMGVGMDCGMVCVWV